MSPALGERSGESPRLALDAALITSPANVRYLSGLVSSNAAVLLPADGLAVLGTDSRYAEAAERDCPDLELVTERQVEPALARLAAARGCRTLAFEAQEMTVERHSALSALDGSPQLVPLGRVVEQLRTVKDEAEIALLAGPAPSPVRRSPTCCPASCRAGPSGNWPSCWNGR
jgi:Xaa-Pro aminopeptidase